MLTDFLYRMRALFRKSAVEREMEDELRAHLEQETEKLVASGFSREEAMRQARLEFGGLDGVKEECREARGISFVETLLQDVRYGLRQLRRNPGFTAVGIITLALGIGANTAIFSVANALYFTELPVPNPGELVSLGFLAKGNPGIPTVSYSDLQDIRRQGGQWVNLFAYRLGMAGLGIGNQADHIMTSNVDGNYFSTLGVKPALGRLILPSESKAPGPDRVIVLAYPFWKSHFGGKPSILGKAVRLNGHPVTIVGVAQKGFHGVLGAMNVQVFLPMMAPSANSPRMDRADRNLFVLGRLRPGVGLAGADAAMKLIAGRLAKDYPKTDQGARIWLLPQKEAMLNPFPKPGEYQQQLVVIGFFLALALLVLLLACFNLASVLLVRASAREHEMAVRAALGAAGRRLLRQVLTESCLLAFFGCIAGIVVSIWSAAVLQSIHLSTALPVIFHFGFDGRVFAYAVGAAILAALVVGILPALRAARANAHSALREGQHSVAGGRHRLRRLLVMAQIAGSVLLLIVAGLFTRSLLAAQKMNLGFNPDHILMVAMDPGETGYNQAQGQEFYDHLLRRMRALPGVRQVSLAFTYPSNGMVADVAPILVQNRPLQPGQVPPMIFGDTVSPGYFPTMGIPIVRGRPFRDSDDEKAPLVAVINQAMAQRFWPHQEALGRKFSTSGAAAGPWIEVVGISRNSKTNFDSMTARPAPYFYLPLKQHFSSFETLLVKTAGPPDSAIPGVERGVRRLAPGLPVFNVRTLRQALNGSFTGFYAFHLGTDLAAALGFLGLILAVVGVYGVVSYSMARRTHEIGVRIAVGAQRSDILWMALRQAVALIAVGAAIGVLLALGLAKFMANVVYGISAYDPVAFVSATLLVAIVALLACAIPARRAARVDPVVALRHE